MCQLPICLAEEQARLVEKATTTQQKCKRCYEERKFRITTSKFGLVAKRNRNHYALAKQLLYRDANNLSMPAVMWGYDAIRTYEKFLKPVFFVEEAKPFVSSCGFLGTSPDGVVCSGERTIKLIKVKCPYRARQGTVHEICSTMPLLLA